MALKLIPWPAPVGFPSWKAVREQRSHDPLRSNAREKANPLGDLLLSPKEIKETIEGSKPKLKLHKHALS